MNELGLKRLDFKRMSAYEVLTDVDICVHCFFYANSYREIISVLVAIQII